MNSFFMVLRDDASSFSQIRHPSEETAREEAERLSKKTGKRFIILKAIAFVQPAELPVEWHAVGDTE